MATPYITSSGKTITGTLMWYYAICKREVWLMGHDIMPDEDSPALEIGRAIHEISYDRAFKEVSLDGIKIDLLRKSEQIICEVKTSSKFVEAARFQLLYYLYRLKEYGVKFSGWILIPKERKKLRVVLDAKSEKLILRILKDIKTILKSPYPPKPVKIFYCKRCAYKDFCWV